MTVLYKQPSETKIYAIEFANQLASGDSLASITSVTESTGDITITSTAISGTTVQATYASGTDGTTYTITAIVVTTNGETIETDVYLRVIDSSSTTYTASYFGLLERIGHYLFGRRTGFTGDQVSDIEDCMSDGLRDVYAAHQWSFFKPIEEITTTAPYATGTITVASGVVTLTGGTFPSWAAVGVLKIVNDYYDVNTRDSGTQITLEDTSVTVAAASSYSLGRAEYDLPAAFEAISGDSDLHYEPGQAECYPPVAQRHDNSIRRMLQDNPYFDRPTRYSVRTVQFDPTVGSRKRLAFYPTPDAAYVLKVPMLLRPTMIDETNLYPVGGETLTQVIVEACLAAAERNFEEQPGTHTKRLMELLPFAVAADMEKSSPTSLGPDAPRGSGYHYGIRDYTSRALRMGAITLDGDTL